MKTVNDVLKAIEAFAPCALAQDSDAVGLLAGRGSAAVTRVLTALEVTGGVIDEAEEKGAQLIVTHHPVYFAPSRATGASVESDLTLKLIENKIAAICMHTNLDAAPGGINHILARMAGLSDTQALSGGDRRFDANGTPLGLGRYGELGQARPFLQYAREMKRVFGAPCVRVYDAKRSVLRVGVGSGSGGAVLRGAYEAGCDTFLTGELKYSLWLEAAHYNLNVVELGHFETEDIACPLLMKIIKDALPDLEVLKSEGHKSVVGCL